MNPNKQSWIHFHIPYLSIDDSSLVSVVNSRLIVFVYINLWILVDLTINLHDSPFSFFHFFYFRIFPFQEVSRIILVFQSGHILKYFFPSPLLFSYYFKNPPPHYCFLPRIYYFLFRAERNPMTVPRPKLSPKSQLIYFMSSTKGPPVGFLLTRELFQESHFRANFL